MSASLQCCNPCDSLEVTNVPGVEGDPGINGTNGTPGVGPNTFLTVDLPNVTASGDQVSATVTNNAGFAIGQTVFIADPSPGTDHGTFRVISKAGTTTMVVEFLEAGGDTTPPFIVGSGGLVVGTGSPTALPIAIADGGTGAATKATAQVALGLGQALTSDFDDALAYDITNSVAQITGIQVTTPAAGLYKVEGCISVLYTGVTFAASRLLTIRARNTTSSVTATEKTVGTNIHTTLSFPAIDYVLPPVTVALALNDVVQLQCGLDTVESAGSSVVTDAWLSITPIALS